VALDVSLGTADSPEIILGYRKLALKETGALLPVGNSLESL
jgi:hypothetical protein